jgi:phosphoglycolate phosphatase
MARLPALLFDLDGTLVDSAAGIAAALSMLRVERGGMAVPATAVRPLVSLGAEVLVARALGSLARDPAADLAAFRTILAGLPANRDTIYAQVEGALATLRQAGHPIAIVTNKPEGLSRTLLHDLGLARYFGAIVGGDTADFPKPHPAPIRWALSRLAVPAHDAVLIGDSHVDAGAARACGIPFILYAGGYGADDCAPADVAARFDDFDDLPGLIAWLGQGRAQGRR